MAGWRHVRAGRGVSGVREAGRADGGGGAGVGVVRGCVRRELTGSGALGVGRGRAGYRRPRDLRGCVVLRACPQPC
ncbi:hypothetical protein E2C01_036312 [Portunus trituberculatus]|uniref:Uncharacterized protein n=1 Tax=Portunus trituberculatus TaxID=210409 RepID=A0A5B7FB14_PORTR|nr:hypothetical protein [Portunus trituberculatus]